MAKHFTVAVVTVAHLLTVLLLISHGIPTTPVIGAVAFAYTRGLLHALDADHLAMIDGSTRKLLAENRAARHVGAAFSLGHSTVVVAAGLATIAGAAWVREATAGHTATTLATIGESVSALYLLAVAAANVPLLWATNPHEPTMPPDTSGHGPSVAGGGAHTAMTPRGPWARLLSVPLRWVQGARHIYLMGVLFGLGFDTASTIAMLILTTLAAGMGASPMVLVAIPVAFTAAMCLGDGINAHLMWRAYTSSAAHAPRTHRIITGVSIGAALVIGGTNLARLLTTWLGGSSPDVDFTALGWALAGFAVAAAAGTGWLTRRHHHTPAH